MNSIDKDRLIGTMSVGGLTGLDSSFDYAADELIKLFKEWALEMVREDDPVNNIGPLYGAGYVKAQKVIRERINNAYNTKN